MRVRLVTAALGGAAMLATWMAPTPLAVFGGEGTAQAAEARGGDGTGGRGGAGRGGNGGNGGAGGFHRGQRRTNLRRHELEHH
jgi:hypothetical protein